MAAGSGGSGWGLGSSGLPHSLSLVMVWAQDICLKMAFTKSAVQVTDAVKNIKDLEDFQFAPKATLTGIIMVSWVGGLPPSWAVWGSHSADRLPPGQRS